MMRIAYIINHLGQSGVNQVVADLVTMFTKHGHQCVIYYLKDCANPMDYLCQTVRTGKKWNGQDTYDVIHAHGLGPMLYVAMHRHEIIKCQGNMHRPLFVTTLHCYCFQDLPSLYGWAKGGMMACAYLFSTLWQDKVVCLSQDMMRYYSRWVKQGKLSYVYNTRILPELSSVTFNSEDKILVDKLEAWHRQGFQVIGMNGVLIRRKGVDLILQALQLLNAGCDKYRLVLIGDGQDKEELVALSETLGLQGMVLFAGHRQDAYRFLPYYDVLAMPSHSEGFPLSLLEAAAYGKRVVVSELPIVKECFAGESRQELPNGLEVVAFKIDANVEETVKRLSEAVREAMKEKNMGVRLHSRYENEYAPDLFAQHYLRVYNEI